MMRSDIRKVVCTCLALGTQVQVQALYRMPYYVADACSAPAQYVSDPAECDHAASALGLSPGILPTMAFGGYCAKWSGGGLGAMSSTSSSWYYYYANNQAGAKSICKLPDDGSPTPSPTASPTPSPTASPTASPTPIPTPSPPTTASYGSTAPFSGWPTPHPTFPPGAGTSGAGGVAATGDPHLQNVHGERFDVMQPGRHVLIHIPRGEPAALLRVVAEASRLGQQCSDMYFQALNVTGAWAEAKRAGGYQYRSGGVVSETPEWIGFGKVELKVVHGRTEHGALYLNFYVRHLGQAGLAVGGLLGEDDHQDAETPPEECVQRISLLAGAPDTHNDGSAPWAAVGSFE